MFGYLLNATGIGEQAKPVSICDADTRFEQIPLYWCASTRSCVISRKMKPIDMCVVLRNPSRIYLGTRGGACMPARINQVNQQPIRIGQAACAVRHRGERPLSESRHEE